MHIKKNIIAHLFLLLFQHNICSTIQPISFDNKGHRICIREIKKNEFDSIKELGIRAFGPIYNFTTIEQIENLKKIYDLIIIEERNYFKDNHQNIVALVATYHDKIIGYISLHVTDINSEVYGRFLVIDPDFQNQGICKNLLKRCRQLLPDAKKVICLTNKNNPISQRFYVSLGGKKIENPYWIQFLYKSVDKSNYIGYEFDEKALAEFDKQMPERI